MMFQLLFRERAVAVKHVCHECEAQRALLRTRGVRTWEPYQALCFRCYGRHVAPRRSPTSAAGIPATASVPQTKHAAVA